MRHCERVIGKIRALIGPLILFPKDMHDAMPVECLEEFKNFGVQRLQGGVLDPIATIDLLGDSWLSIRNSISVKKTYWNALRLVNPPDV